MVVEAMRTETPVEQLKREVATLQGQVAKLHQEMQQVQKLVCELMPGRLTYVPDDLMQEQG